jgi:hypothetical protein
MREFSEVNFPSCRYPVAVEPWLAFTRLSREKYLCGPSPSAPANYPNYREILGIGRPYLPAEAGALNEDCRYRVRALDRVIVILRLLNQQMG